MPAWAVWGGLLQQGALRARLAVVYGSGHKVERDEPEEVSGPQKCFWGNSLTGCSVKRVWWLIRQAWSLLPSIARFQLCALLVSERGLKAPGSPVKGVVCSESLPDSSAITFYQKYWKRQKLFLSLKTKFSQILRWSFSNCLIFRSEN